MKKSSTNSPVPSTSTTKVPKSHSTETEPIPKEDEILTLKSLEVISKIAGMLKTENDSFVTILEKILALFHENQSDEKEVKYGLLKEVISNISEADTDELISAKGYFQRILSQKKAEHVLTKETDQQEPLVTGILSQKESKHDLVEETDPQEPPVTGLLSLEKPEPVVVKQTDPQEPLLTGILSQKKSKYVLIKDTDLKTTLGTVTCEGRLNICHSNILRQANGIWKKVAIKRAILSENDKFIEQEAKVLSQLNHKNIMKFYGKREAKPEIVLEFMDLLDLVDAIMKINFTTGNLLRILENVASSMEYLTEKQYLHRNLTCFNVFLNTKKQCKIGNFGFAVYVGNSNGVYIEEDCSIHMLDVKNLCETDAKAYFFSGSSCSIALSNLAPETLDTKAFSTATDVWSMGLLCWDTFAFADQPMNLVQLGITRGDFSSKQIQLPRSQNCPDVLYQYITKDLLNRDPKKRPRFTDIRTKIKEIASNMHV